MLFLQIRYVRYTAKTQPDFILDDAFKARLRKIAAHIELNRTDIATYESQKVVRDFGTHVTTSVDMGAALVQVNLPFIHPLTTEMILSCLILFFEVLVQL